MRPFVLYIHVKTDLFFHYEAKIIILEKWQQNLFLEGEIDILLVWTNAFVLFPAQYFINPLSGLEMERRRKLVREFTAIEDYKFSSIISSIHEWVSLRIVHTCCNIHHFNSKY